MLQATPSSKLRRSFGVIIAFCIMIIFFVGYDDIRAKVRDVKRKGDMQELIKALDVYYDRHGTYPVVTDDDWQGWDQSYESDGSANSFLQPLVDEGILKTSVHDPYNNKTFFYRYKKFAFGTYDCLQDYVVLQVVNFETWQEDHGRGSCPKYDFVKELPNGYTIFRAD